MVSKNRPKKPKATLDSVLSTVERGFADLEGKMERGFSAVAEDIARLDTRVEELDGKLDRVDTKLTKFEES